MILKSKHFRLKENLLCGMDLFHAIGRGDEIEAGLKIYKLEIYIFKFHED